MVLLALLSSPLAHAQEDPAPDPAAPVTPPGGIDNFPTRIPTGVKVIPNWVNFEIGDMMKYFAAQMNMNLVIDDERNLKDTVTVIGRKSVPVEQAYEAFLMALEAKGYTTVTAGGFTRIIKSGEAGKTPIVVSDGNYIPDSWQYITQIVQPDNVAVGDISKVIDSMISAEGKYIQYLPTNTLIITDSGVNLRKIVKMIKNLDVAAPKSSLEIVPLQYATASEVAQIIEELYGTAASGSEKQAAAANNNRSKKRNRRNRNRNRPERDKAPAANSGAGTTAGKASSYISKVIAEERTNSLIVLANEEGHKAVKELLEKVDVDVDLTSRSQIHVVFLEHAKAEDIAQVLSNLSQNGSSGKGGNQTTRRTSGSKSSKASKAAAAAAAKSKKGNTGVVAAFDSGMRITHDENTNSLVIIASPEDFRVVKSVIDDLDVRRRQVYVDAVILEISSDDEFEIGVAYHGPVNTPIEGAVGVTGGQFGASSIGGISQDLLTGLALGVFGPSIPVETALGTVNVPAFGIVLNALKSNSSVNIVSNPNLMTLDNEEASIVVGKKIPFPTSSGINNLTGQPIVSYQREDVAITLKLTPRVNSSDFVTLELVLEVAEIEEDNRGLDQNTAGFITSKREIETTALVADNQTIVLGGLMGSTETDVETKVPILGDLPILGTLFRGSRKSARRTNLMIFLTPHIIDSNEDMIKIITVKEAQRQEFLRRFYGKSAEDQQEQMRQLLRFSMNMVDSESEWRDPAMKTSSRQGWEDDQPTEAVRDAIEEGIEDAKDEESSTESDG